MRALGGIILCVSLLIGAACSSPPTAEGGGQEAVKATAEKELQDIGAQLEGLDDEARRKKLIELADKEGGSCTAYGSVNLAEADPILAEFEEDTGIEPSYYFASSNNLLQRIEQESEAGFSGVDLVTMDAAEMFLLDEKGLVANVESPVTEDLPPRGILDNWVWFYYSTFTVARNTEAISEAEAPKTWEEALNSPESLGMEVGDFDLFATLIKDYFVEEKGMSEEEAIELFKKGASGASIVDGHTLMTELTAAGEFDIAFGAYVNRIEQMKKEGAPLEWLPPPEPLVIQPNGIGIHASAQNPACALLLYEYLLTDTQEMLGEFDRQPASTAVSGGELLKGLETVVVDSKAITDEIDKWEGLWDEVLTESEGKVITE